MPAPSVEEKDIGISKQRGRWGSVVWTGLTGNKMTYRNQEKGARRCNEIVQQERKYYVSNRRVRVRKGKKGVGRGLSVLLLDWTLLAGMNGTFPWVVLHLQ